uniref:protein-tyrosine-phosphatase n=1 Tax=Strigamia maritima TaxID=126957 RepID=T1INZ0_STRMM
MVRVLNGDFTSQVKKHVVIDCRFPYEFEGGHIRGARNIYSKEKLEQEFLKVYELIRNPRFDIPLRIFRGSSMSRFLRGKDRETNTVTNEYPNLHYPEIYVLDGGYKAFFECCEELCEPQSYKPMLHPDHGDEMKFYFTQSKKLKKEAKKIRIGRRLKSGHVIELDFYLRTFKFIKL